MTAARRENTRWFLGVVCWMVLSSYMGVIVEGEVLALKYSAGVYVYWY